MTPEQFNQLREGDIIRNQNGNGFSVLERRGGVVLAQCVQSVPQSLSGLWTLCARLEPAVAECVAPAVPKTRPPTQYIERILLDIGFAKITDARSTVWRSRNGSDFFVTAEGAWDSLPSNAVQETGTARLERFRTDLLTAGWRRVPETASTWRSSMGVKVRGTWAAWTVMKLGQR